MKKILLSLFALLALNSLFAKDLYQEADEETRNIIVRTDNLINKKLYAAAWDLVSGEENEYILAKKTEIAIYYFAQSMMHQLFAFKDLKFDETLYDVRNSEGPFSLVVFNPADRINKYVAEHGEKAILDFALGMYYEDVLERYGDDWIIPREELEKNVLDYLKKAYDQGYYDDYSLSVLASAIYRTEDYMTALEIYAVKEEEYEFTGTDNYHTGIALWMLDQGEEGVEYVKKSIDLYADEPEYQSDSYIVVARIYIDIGQYEEAKKYLDLCHEKFPSDYRYQQYNVQLYAAQNQTAKAVEYGLELFAMAPTNPTVCQLIMKVCNYVNKEDVAIEFFKSAVKKYKKDNEAMANLYFHYAYEYSIMENYNQAKKMAGEARKYFEKSNSMTEEIDDLLKEIEEGN